MWELINQLAEYSGPEHSIGSLYRTVPRPKFVKSCDARFAPYILYAAKNIFRSW